MNKSRSVYYFSYGTSIAPEMIKAMIGRTPRGFPAELKNYQLCIQEWKEIPQNYRKVVTTLTAILGRNLDRWQAYTIKKGVGVVRGRIWAVSKEEREIIKNWELWYQKAHVRVTKLGDTDGKTFAAETDILGRDQKASRIVDGKKYPPFIINKGMMLRLAEEVRKGFLSKKA